MPSTPLKNASQTYERYERIKSRNIWGGVITLSVDLLARGPGLHRAQQPHHSGRDQDDYQIRSALLHSQPPQGASRGQHRRTAGAEWRSAPKAPGPAPLVVHSLGRGLPRV